MQNNSKLLWLLFNRQNDTSSLSLSGIKFSFEGVRTHDCSKIVCLDLSNHPLICLLKLKEVDITVVLKNWKVCKLVVGSYIGGFPYHVSSRCIFMELFKGEGTFPNEGESCDMLTLSWMEAILQPPCSVNMLFLQYITTFTLDFDCSTPTPSFLWIFFKDKCGGKVKKQKKCFLTAFLLSPNKKRFEIF